jgi:hypothetical protein
MQRISSQATLLFARFSKIPVSFRNRGSSMCVVTRQDVMPSICGSIPDSGKGFSSFQRFQTESPANAQWVLCRIIREIKLSGRDINLLSLYSSEVKNEWSSASLNPGLISLHRNSNFSFVLSLTLFTTFHD